MRHYDPRTKLLAVIVLSTLGVVVRDLALLSAVLVLGFLTSAWFGADPLGALRRLRRLVIMLVAIALLQSMFNAEGRALLQIGELVLLSTGGLVRGAAFLLRMSVVLVSASVVATADEREMIQGLVQSGVPGEMAFMVALGVRFLPMLAQEMKDTLTALSLRGVDLKRVPLCKKVSTYALLLLPVLVGTVKKAEAISLSMETKGFRAMPGRSSYLELSFARADRILMACFCALFVLVLWLYLG